MLFYDPILSGDTTQSCAGCHDPAFSWADPRPLSIGIEGRPTRRHAPAIINTGFMSNDMFWDGRASSLESQAAQPVPDPDEMNLPWPEAVSRVAADPKYPPLFGAAFGDESVTQQRITMAIAQFERTMVSYNTEYEVFLRGEGTISDAALRGAQLFFAEGQDTLGTGDCFHCHGNNLFTVNDYFDIGLDTPYVDLGRGEITGAQNDWGTFKAPTLRNVALTAPYMHDGRFATLQEVLEHYNRNDFANTANIDPNIRARNARPKLTQQEIDDIIAFLHTLTDTTFLNNPDFQNPFEP